MIALIGAVLLAGAGTSLVLMLVLQKTVVGEGSEDVPREDDPARFERNFFFTAFAAAAGAILLLIGTT